VFVAGCQQVQLPKRSVVADGQTSRSFRAAKLNGRRECPLLLGVVFGGRLRCSFSDGSENGNGNGNGSGNGNGMKIGDWGLKIGVNGD
jgi:hypothetical protein